MNFVEPIDRKGQNRNFWTGQYLVGRFFARRMSSSSKARPAPARRRSRCSFCSKARTPAKRCLYITLSETERELRDGAASHGWIAGRQHRSVRIAAAGEPARFRTAAEPAVFVRPRTRRDHQADLRSRRTRRGRTGSCSTACPKSGCWRRARCATGGRFWRSSIIFAKFGTTVLLLDDLTAEVADKTVHSVAHGVIRLEELAPAYGAERRRVRVHQVSRRQISRRLPRRHHHDRRRECLSAAGGVGISRRLSSAASVSSGIAELDQLLGGGIETGSSTLILGPAGTGKSLAAIVFIARRDRAWRKGGDCSCSTKSSACCSRA